jgi:hypothetical protein
MRQASFDDYDQIAALESRLGLTPRSRQQWLHIWQINPAYQEIRGWPIGWVFEDEEGRIVGSIGNIPLLYHFGGSKYLGATFRGWAVDQKYRAFSLMLVAHQLQHPQVDLQLVTTAGPMPQEVFTRLGWLRVPVGQWDRAAFWVTNYTGTIRHYLEEKAPAVSRLANPLLHAPLLLTDSFCGRKRRFKAGYQLGWCNSFDERFDRFWADLQASSPALFLSCRARNTLAWHFRNALEKDRVWILTASDGPRLVGYAVLQRKDAQSIKITRMMLVDFLTLGNNAELPSAMISFALDRCRQERIHILENAGCWIEELQLVVDRPSRHRALEAWSYLYKATNQELAAMLRSAVCWYPTQYDGDASL